MTDRVLASFLWLDKLGLGAQLGLDVIVRQTIWGYNYPLLNVDYNPNPVSVLIISIEPKIIFYRIQDWWISVLYKLLVGTKVLSITHDGEDSRPVRLYAHCAKSGYQWGDHAVVGKIKYLFKWPWFYKKCNSVWSQRSWLCRNLQTLRVHIRTWN